MSPSTSIGPGRAGITGSFTQAGVLLVVRNQVGFNRGLGSAGKAVRLFGKELKYGTMLTKQQRGLLTLQQGITKVGGALLKVAAVAAAAGVLITGVLGVKALQVAADIQQLTFALEGLVGIELGRRAQEAGGILDMTKAMADAVPVTERLVEGLRDVALATPISYEQVFAALRLQIAYGAAATATETFTQKIREFGLDMKKAESPALAMAEAVAQVGAVLARDSATFERLNYNLAQAIQKGILTAKNMRELKNAGLDLEQVFKEELNMTLKETDAAFKAGTISTEDMSVAFISFADKYFAPAAKRMTRSLKGLIANFGDLWAFAAADTMTPMIEIITEKLGKWFDQMEVLVRAGHFEQLGENIANATQKVLDFGAAIGNIPSGLKETTLETLAFAAGLTILGSLIIQTINGLVALKASLALALGTIGLELAAVWPLLAAGAVILGIYALIRAVKNLEEQHRAEAVAILEASKTYDDYIEQLDEAGRANYALEESLWATVKAKQAQDAAFDVDELQDAVVQVKATIFELNNLAQTWDSIPSFTTEAEEATFDFNKALAQAVSEMSDMELVVASNEEQMRAFWEAEGLVGDELKAVTRDSVAFAKTEARQRLITKFLAEQHDDLGRSLYAGARAQREARYATEQTTDALITQEAAIKQLQDAIKEIDDAYQDWEDAISDTTSELQDLAQDATDAYKDYKDDIKDINADLGKDLDKIAEKYDDAMPDATSDQERVESLIDVWDEWARRMKAIQEVGGPEENLEQEGGWLAEIREMTEGTDFAFREAEITISGWMMELQKAFYAGELPDSFYEEAKSTRGWQIYFAEIEALRAADEKEATDANNRKIADAKRALDAENAQIAEARADALLQGALELLAATGQLEGIAEDALGPMASLADTPAEAFKNLTNGVIEFGPVWQAAIGPMISGLLTVGESAEGMAEKTDTALGALVEKAGEAATSTLPALKAEYEDLQKVLQGRELGALSPEELDAVKTRLAEVTTLLGGFGLAFGAEFPGAPEAMQTKFEGMFADIIQGLKDLGIDNTAALKDMEDDWGTFGEYVFDVLIGKSVTTDFADATGIITTSWDGLMTHLVASLVTTTATIKGTWKSHISSIKTYLTTLTTALNNVKEKLQEIKEMDPIEVTIKITVEASPPVPLTKGIDKVQEMVEALLAIPSDIHVAITANLDEAIRVGAGLGDAIIRFAKASMGKKGGRLDLLKELLEPAKKLSGLGDFFGKLFSEQGVAEYNAQLEEIDKLLEEQTLSEEDRNRLLEERNRLEEDHIRQQETLTRLEKARADLDFLDRQVQLLELIRNHHLNAKEILGGITLGIDASAAELMEVTTRALEAIVQQINETLQIGSASKVMVAVGKFMMQGLGKGIMDAAAFPLQAATSAAIAPVMATAQAGSTMNLTMNNTISNGMDLVVFENRVLDVVRRGVRGY